MEAYTLQNDKLTRLSKDELKSNNNIWIRSINPDAGEIELLSKITKAPVEQFREFLDTIEFSAVKNFSLRSTPPSIRGRITAIIFNSKKTF